MRLTHATYAVAVVIMDHPEQRHWGFEICKLMGIKPGVVQPILRRMADSGWLMDQWEEPEVKHREGRPPRRYYTLTPEGSAALAALLARAAVDGRFRRHAQ